MTPEKAALLGTLAQAKAQLQLEVQSQGSRRKHISMVARCGHSPAADRRPGAPKDLAAIFEGHSHDAESECVTP